MDEMADLDSADGNGGLPRRWFLRGVGGGLLAFGAGMLLAGCPSTSQSDDNTEHGEDGGEDDNTNDGDEGNDDDNGDNNNDGDDGDGGDGGGDGGAGGDGGDGGAGGAGGDGGGGGP